MHCDCTKSAGYTAMHGKDGRGNPIQSTFNYDLWVCATCMRPSRMVFTKLTLNSAPRRATSLLSVAVDASGRSIITWGTTTSGERIKTMMFNAYPRKMDMDQGRNVCLEMWRRLDGLIDKIKAGDTGEQVELTKARATELSENIALVMSPFYSDSVAVLQESQVRWTARQEGREHESPGLAEGIWDPANRWDGTPYSRDAVHKVRNGGASVAKKAVKFDEQKLTFIRHTLENGQMSPEVLAGMFECSVEDIKAVMS